ncbi:Transcription termination factor 1, mitochondrial [Merluccius polli]|uniref:Transcription termination factor 1, mitochondrial n=1 Tax=Merluccius polli TaxID=89951 RepID=A0AA47MAD1_MERPO|nr:Transcription termination factor 1, mitochondrial [Merluccius polli]
MTLVSGTRAVLSLRRSVALQCSSSLLAIRRASPWPPVRGLCTVTPTPDGGGDGGGIDDGKQQQQPQPSKAPENVSLLENLSLLGVDLKKARQRQPGVLRRLLTNENDVAGFLRAKGAGREAIASIISRYPRAITRSRDHLEQRWALWRRVFACDSEVVGILSRSPESFFRTSDNENLEKNIAFLTSLGFGAKALHRLVTTAPRTFSNSPQLNRQMVELLEEVGAELGLTDRSPQTPRQFAKAVIGRNVYILIRSTKRVRRNVAELRASLRLGDGELLALLQGPGAEVLDLSNEYLSKNFKGLQRRMASEGCAPADVRRLVMSHPMVLYTGTKNLNAKLDCLLRGGITMEQVVDKPKVLDYSMQNMAARIQELRRVGYDFQKSGIAIMDTSRKRFDAKMEKLTAAPPPPPPPSSPPPPPPQEEGG